LELIKSDKARCEQVLNTVCQALQLVCTLLEPYIPSFSAKIYEQMALPRTEKQEKMLALVGQDVSQLRSLVPGGHKIGNVAPIFRNITTEEV